MIIRYYRCLHNADTITGEGAGNATFMLDITEDGAVEDFVPGDGSDGNATFV